MNIRVTPLTFALCCLVGAVTTPAFAQGIDDLVPAEVHVEGDTIYYTGDIGPGDAAAFRNALKSGEGIRRLVINSEGGDTDVGMRIGRLVAAKGLDVEVVGTCFSSRANYIFVAGKNKRIAPGAYVAWHGSLHQFDILALREPGKTAREVYDEECAAYAAYTESEDKCVASDEEWQAQEAAKGNESRFFDEIGVDVELTVHGLRPDKIDAYEASGKSGWTYSIADMERFGVTNVSYLGEGRYEESEAVKANLVVLPYDE